MLLPLLALRLQRFFYGNSCEIAAGVLETTCVLMPAPDKPDTHCYYEPSEECRDEPIRKHYVPEKRIELPLRFSFH